MHERHRSFNCSFNTLIEVIEWGITKRRLTCGARGSAARCSCSAWMPICSFTIQGAWHHASFHTASSVCRSYFQTRVGNNNSARLLEQKPNECVIKVEWITSCSVDLNENIESAGDERWDRKRYSKWNKNRMTLFDGGEMKSNIQSDLCLFLRRGFVMLSASYAWGGLAAEAPRGIYTN